jgi:hypothetical protein
MGVPANRCSQSGWSKDDGKKTLDDGLLDCSWFGPGIEFRKTEDIDYAWVKAGFTLKGRKIFIDKWADPVFLGTERNAKDSANATHSRGSRRSPPREWTCS